MGATNAERQRRYRAHKAGNHSLCDPSRCSGATEAAVTSPVTGVMRNGETRGRRLWREMDGDSRTGGERALVEEACRITDRLDRLDGLLDGDLESLLRFRISDDGTEVTVTVNNVLAEARQQAAVLKQIVSELRQSSAKPAAVRHRGAPDKTSGGVGVATGVADLTTRIAERRAQAQG